MVTVNKRIGSVLASIFLVSIIHGHLDAQSGIYDRAGIIPGHGSHGSLPEENIDLFTGNVTLRYRDVFLPGPNGLNVEVWRVYNSKILSDWQSGNNPKIQAYHQSWVGIGWTMHMGMVHQETSSTPIVEFPDGRLETAYLDQYDAQGRNLTRDFLRYDKSSHKLYFQNGVIWTLGVTRTITRADGTQETVRLVTQIENSFGHFIVIAYNSGSPTMSTITDSFGRVITFTSSGTPRKLSKISYQYAAGLYREFNYSVGTFSNGYTKLNSCTPPCLPQTLFEYNDGTSSHYELKKITTSYGGVLEYSYGDHAFYFNGTRLNSRVLVQKKITFNPNDQGIWNYTYPDYNGVTTGTVNVQGPIYNTNVTYNAYDATCPWKIGLINMVQAGDNSLSETYDWTYEEISNQQHWWVLTTDLGTAKGPLLSSVVRHREGNATLKEEYLYEDTYSKRYGLSSKTLRYVNGSPSPLNYKTTQYYFGSFPSYKDRYLLSLPSVEYEYSGSGTMLKEKVTEYFQNETGKWGAVQRVRRLKDGSGSSFYDWTYTYQFDNAQGVTIYITTIGPSGSQNLTTYKYGVKMSEKVGDTELLSGTISQYDSSVSAARTQDGATISYTYDALGRPTLEDWPNDRNDVTIYWRSNNENREDIKQGNSTDGYYTVTKYGAAWGESLATSKQAMGRRSIS